MNKFVINNSQEINHVFDIILCVHKNTVELNAGFPDFKAVAALKRIKVCMSRDKKRIDPIVHSLKG